MIEYIYKTSETSEPSRDQLDITTSVYVLGDDDTFRYIINISDDMELSKDDPALNRTCSTIAKQLEVNRIAIRARGRQSGFVFWNEKEPQGCEYVNVLESKGKTLKVRKYKDV